MVITISCSESEQGARMVCLQDIQLAAASFDGTRGN